MMFKNISRRKYAYRLLKMFDKKLWPTIIYTVILFGLCVTVWQLRTDSDHVTEYSAIQYNVYTTNTTGYSYPLQTLPHDDYHRLINLKNFTFTIFNNPCNESNPTLLILVHSNPKNFEKRKIVRETWGKNTPQVKVLFIIGLVKIRRLKMQLQKENEEFGDLIQGSFYDAYRNMTYKHVMVLKYAIYHCPQAKYILKTDDDVFVNMPLMLNFLNLDLSPFGGSRMIFCTLRKNSPAMRSWRSKWRVSFKEYPDKVYPPYCPGWAIIYSPDVVFELYREAQKTDYFWIDDVHITGTLVAKIHLSHVNIDSLVLDRKEQTDALHQPSRCNRTFLYGAPNMNNREIKALWECVKTREVHVSLLKYIT
ncbi:beta-1,3-galactosyltransferase 5 isoform X2 [Tribolium madens]|uniref:beta-1,3-galactosyltransferase 5 isoform X2 n=1 Tax=Tribolium madens TaxID=41895 RepID=UPI001CF72150|nr:beta-1,3-galactosyltransferase 5 isoform X2 [Tribolium madens]